MNQKTHFSKKLLRWYQNNGRKNLPWRVDINPYRVWLSEIMLQQTQVKTVIPYFLKFTQRFPTIVALAKADLDEVLVLWAGLGYYSRARNLYRTAKIIVEKCQGKFPKQLADLIALPGIGRSTAGAIMAIAFGEPAPILDGNVKRVFSRYFAITQQFTEKKVIELLWQQAKTLLPKKNIADYTQALMDLGATVCTPKQPRCDICPVHKNCAALSQNIQHILPLKNNTRTVPKRETYMLIIQNDQGEILMEKRAPIGIWGGLWCLPVCDTTENIEEYCQQHFDFQITLIKKLPQFVHRFTHFSLQIMPLIIQIHNNPQWIISENNAYNWCDLLKLKHLALPTPIKKLLAKFAAEKKHA